MMLSASPCSLAKSSLEEMLDSLRRRDEEEKEKKDSPPALPSRPASRARLPPARRSLPNNFKDFKVRGLVGSSGAVVENGFVENVNGESKRKETSFEYKRRGSSFGRKRMKKDVESPYFAALSASGMVSELEGDTISYFIKMVTVNSEWKEKKSLIFIALKLNDGDEVLTVVIVCFLKFTLEAGVFVCGYIGLF